MKSLAEITAIAIENPSRFKLSGAGYIDRKPHYFAADRDAAWTCLCGEFPEMARLTTLDDLIECAEFVTDDVLGPAGKESLLQKALRNLISFVAKPKSKPQAGDSLGAIAEDGTLIRGGTLGAVLVKKDDPTSPKYFVTARHATANECYEFDAAKHISSQILQEGDLGGSPPSDYCLFQMKTSAGKKATGKVKFQSGLVFAETYSNPAASDVVYLSGGGSTGMSVSGTVASAVYGKAVVRIDGVDYEFKDHILIESAGNYPYPFGIPGDSGSIIFRKAGSFLVPLGLYIGKSKDSKYFVATPLKDIFASIETEPPNLKLVFFQG